jgi:BlaI family penicillinase repressor
MAGRREVPPRISRAEWEVMNVVWDRAPVTAGEVVEALADATGWHARTIKTMLGRLVKKRALRYRAEGKRYLYSPAVSRDECIRSESESFLDRVFGGEVEALVMHFVENGGLSPEQSEQLQRLLAEKGEVGP